MIADSGSPPPGVGQLMNVANAGSVDLLVTQHPARSDGPASGGGTRYVCTASGFGQIANCTLH